MRGLKAAVHTLMYYGSCRVERHLKFGCLVQDRHYSRIPIPPNRHCSGQLLYSASIVLVPALYRQWPRLSEAGLKQFQ